METMPPPPPAPPIPPPPPPPPPTARVAAPIKASTDETLMDLGTDSNIDLGTAHHQCSTARKATMRTNGVSFVLSAAMPFGTTATVDAGRVGALDGTDGSVLRTYHGARAIRDGGTINQSISLSFDPSNLMCLSCETEHPIIGTDRPVTVIGTDQNFVPFWPGTVPDRCITVIRIENPSLHELIDFFHEVFHNYSFPEGSIFLLGSTSYLHRVGFSLYCMEWGRVVGRVSLDWPGVRLGPLIPLITSDVPGGVTRDIMEVSAWFAKVYDGTFLGFKDCWTKTVQLSMANSAGVSRLSNVESYTLCAPASIDKDAVLVSWTFFTDSTRPSLLKGLDKGQQSVLLDLLAVSLERDFHIPPCIGSIPENALQGSQVKEPFKKIILVGASILKKTCVFLETLGFETVDLCGPGWIATPAAVAELRAKLESINISSDTAVVFDVFGNSTTRVELYDGSTSLPVKIGNGFHLPGTVQVCTDNIFEKIIETVMPLFLAVKDNMRIIVPPQPRYVFSGCCSDATHSTNVPNALYPNERMLAFSRLRAHLKKSIVPRLGNNFWIADGCIAIKHGNDLKLAVKQELLKPLMAADGVVHLTPEGYRNAASNIGCILESVQRGKIGKLAIPRSNASLVSGTRRHHWRGFSSPVGSKKPATTTSQLKMSRSRQSRSAVPYAGGRGGVRR
jgi:hypothetical protein